MTNSDQLMLAAIKAQTSFRINGREVTVEGDMTAVSLYGSLLARLSFKDMTMTIAGETIVSRKSARVFNVLFREFTDFEIVSNGGQWILKGAMGEPMPVNPVGVTVPMRKCV